jgi:hypothetical protein
MDHHDAGSAGRRSLGVELAVSTTFNKREIMEALGWREIVEETLPAGPGICMDEVGALGPWYGVSDGKSMNYGWTREPNGCWGLAFDELLGWESAALRLVRMVRELQWANERSSV